MTCPKQHNPDLSAKGLSADPAGGMVLDEPVLADVGTPLEPACTTCTSPLGVFKSGRFYSGYCFSCSRIARDCRASPLLAGALRTNYGDVVPDIERLLTMPLCSLIGLVAVSTVQPHTNDFNMMQHVVHTPAIIGTRDWGSESTPFAALEPSAPQLSTIWIMSDSGIVRSLSISGTTSP